MPDMVTSIWCDTRSEVSTLCLDQTVPGQRSATDSAEDKHPRKPPSADAIFAYKLSRQREILHADSASLQDG